MEKGGSEGDEILIFACRDIGCNIPAGVTSIGQLSTDLFIQIISKSLLLISNGEINVRISFIAVLLFPFQIFPLGSSYITIKYCCEASYLYRYCLKN
jgi:hypothetical protein